MLPRVIPSLLLRDRGLVKTVSFRNPVYVGDPINAIKIFNDKEVDELMLLDITATRERRGPQLDLIAHCASECFMPMAVGGGITTVGQMQQLFAAGVEKVVLNASAARDPNLVRRGADRFGSQSITVSMDVRRKVLGGWRVYIENGATKTPFDPVAYAMRAQEHGAGELLVTSIDQDGTFKGYDLALIRAVASAVDVPVVACGGAGSIDHLRDAVEAGASAVAAGAFFVFQRPHRAVLISFPRRDELIRALGSLSPR